MKNRTTMSRVLTAVPILLAALAAPPRASAIIDPTKLSSMEFKDMAKPSMSLEAAKAAVKEAQDTARKRLLELDQIPVEFGAILMTLPYAAEGERISNPSKSELRRVLNEREAYWGDVWYALYYHQRQAEASTEEGLKGLAAQQGLKLDGALFRTARDMVACGTEFHWLQEIVDAIKSDIRADLETVNITRGNGSQYNADGASYIARKKKLFETIRSGMRVRL